MEKGAQRWIVDISVWNPSREEFSFILSILPQHEHSSMTRFVHLNDRKRALVSRLLQYSLVHEVMNIPFDKIVLKRTLEGKPYLDQTNIGNVEYANFNFNVSHDGDYVGIVSEPFYIVGLDIVSLVVPRQESALEFVKNFSAHFTSNEWENTVSAGTCEDILSQFCKYWCLKEAFIKAIGAGLGYKLDRLEFGHDWTNVSCHIDGMELKEWEFSISEMGKGHWVSIARGHPKDAVESYKTTLSAPDFEETSSASSSVQFTTCFELRTVQQLVPVPFRESHSNYH